tara:strand:+ start:300 stop:1103 length:804 start_codon:yes stop_codon:yes gene_type:complete
MLSRIRREEQKLAVNGTGVNGVQSLNFGYESTAQPISTLGHKNMIYAPSSPQTASISAESLLVYDDFFLEFTGAIPFSGQIDYKNKKVQFTEAYLSSYSSSCSVGEIPTLGMQAEVYGELGTGEFFTPSSSSPHDTTIQTAGYNSINIDLDEFNTNRVISYSLDIQTPRTPIYDFAGRTPAEVVSDSPLDVTLQFNIHPDDYEIKNMRFVPEETVFRDVSLTINENSKNNSMQSFSFNNMLLVSEQYQINTESTASIAFTLKGTIFR